MKELGRKQLTLHLHEPLQAVPEALGQWALTLNGDGHELEYAFDTGAEHGGIARLLSHVSDLGIVYNDLRTRESSLEEIFVRLIRERA